MMVEQRKKQRFDLKLPVEIIRARATSSFTGETRNISSTGVFFTAEAHFKIGESIEYLITLPTASACRKEVRLYCTGKILRNELGSAFAVTLECHRFLIQTNMHSFHNPCSLLPLQ